MPQPRKLHYPVNHTTWEFSRYKDSNARQKGSPTQAPLLQLRAFTQLTLFEPQRGVRHRLDACDKLRQNRIVVIFSVHKLQRHGEIVTRHINHAAEGLNAFGNSRTEVRPHDKHHVSEARAQGEQLGDA